MSKKTDKEVKGIVPTYIGFLMGKINIIYDEWADGDPESALRRTCLLYYFLVDELKKELNEDVQQINKEMLQAYQLQGSNFFTSQMMRNRRGREIATSKLPMLIGKMMSLFDSRDYLEQHKRAVLMGKEIGY